MKLKQRAAMVLSLAIAVFLIFLYATLLTSNDAVTGLSRDEEETEQELSRSRDEVLVAPFTQHAESVSEEMPRTTNSVYDVAWRIWREWVEPGHLYPSAAFYSEQMDHILAAMATAPVTSLDVGYKGTQLKASLMLESQRTVFKPKRYERSYVIPGEPYAGFDRHNGEIAGFHLDGVLEFNIAPPVVGRVLNLTQLKPLTSEKLLKTYFKRGRDVCFFGVCYYCKKEEAACAEGEMMEGSLTLWLPEWYQLTTRRHPYQRIYRKGRLARWETSDAYCQHLLQPSSEYYHGILEFTDTAIYDFLMGNADRHHYEVYLQAKPHGKLLHIDNGKTFGDPQHDEMSILAPIRQCCRIRRSTWERLKFLIEGPLSVVLDESMKRDPLYPILTPLHLEALDRRHHTIMSVIENCVHQYSEQTVIVDSWG